MDEEDLESIWRTAHPDLDLAKTHPEQSIRPKQELQSTVTPNADTDSLLEEVSFARGLTLGEEIGRGGMGAVFAARQQALGRDIAVKKIHDSHKNTRAKNRFLEEAFVTAHLGHPNIVPVYDLQRTDDGDWLLAMKRVGGFSWKDLLHPKTDAQKERAKDYDRDRHIDILLQVCYALSFAHEKGLSHNDLKPENVMVGEFGEVLLMDWGLALNISEDPNAPTFSPSLQHKSSLQSPCGTPAYMPPELALGKGEEIGPWTDVYLLGAILHEIITGNPPHSGKNLISVLKAAAESKAPEFEKEVPEELQYIAITALAKSPSRRFQKVEDFQKALVEFRSHKESVLITRKALRDLVRCENSLAKKQSQDSLYPDFAEILASFTQALVLWSGNHSAETHLVRARLAYARCAIECGDLGLAQAQLDRLGPQLASAAALRKSLYQARMNQEKAMRSAKWFKTVLGVSLGAIVLTLTIGLIQVTREQEKTEQERAKVEAEKQFTDVLLKFAVDEKKETIRQRDIAIKRAEIAKEALDILVIEVNSKLSDIGGNRIREARIELLDSALEGYEKLRQTKDGKEKPIESIQAYQQIGSIQRRQGKLSEALKSFTFAEKLIAEQTKKKPSPELLKLKIACGITRSKILREQGQLSSSLTLLNSLLIDGRALVKKNPEIEDFLVELSSVLNGLAYSNELKGNLSGAIQYSEESLAIERSLAQKNEEKLAYQTNFAGSLDTLAKLYQKAGQIDKAIPMFKESLRLFRDLAKKRKGELHSERSLMAPLGSLGDIYRDRRDAKRAFQYYREVLEIARRLANKYPGSLDRQTDLAIAYNSLGTLYSMTGNYEQAIVTYKSLHELMEKNTILAPDNDDFKRLSAVGLAMVGKSSFALGKEKEGLEALEKSLEQTRMLVKKSPENKLWIQDYLQSIYILANYYKKKNENAKALPYYRELKKAFVTALRGNSENYQLRSQQIQALWLYADCCAKNGDDKSAIENYQLALGCAISLAKANPKKSSATKSISNVKSRMALYYYSKNDYDKGDKWMNEAIENLRVLAERDPRYNKKLEILKQTYEKIRSLRKQ